ncbi:MAG: DUF1810 domain-containing protein [Ginsengibacter sp.]
MSVPQNLERFLSAQRNTYQQALAEIKNGRKQSHWMWFIFPQIAGLGFSETSKLYAIKNREEARLYMEDAILGSRLIEISKALLTIESKTANQVFGNPDDLKAKSCMTLFSELDNANPVFEAVLAKYFNGEKDTKTLGLIQ